MTESFGSPSPSSGRAASPVERFLGRPEAIGGPFALLQITASDLTDDSILEALDHQIERVAAHPERDTPEADEVRLALHAAAAQLLDPLVRRHLIERWGANTPSVVAPPASPMRSLAAAPASSFERAVIPPTPPPPRPPSVPSSSFATTLDQAAAARRPLERDAMLVMGMSGGWNSVALRRLLGMARSRGLTTDDVVIVLQNLARRSTNPLNRKRPPLVSNVARADASSATIVPRGNAPSSGVSPSSPTAELPSSFRSSPKRVLALGVAGVAVLFLSTLGIIWLGSHRVSPPASLSSTPTTAAQSPQPPPSAQANEKPTTTRDSKDTTSSEQHDHSDLLGLAREIRAAAEASGIDPAQAQTRFAEAVGVLSRGWPRIPNDQLIAANDAVVEYLYRAANDDKALSVGIEAVAAPSDLFASTEVPEAKRVLSTIWSAGMVARLSREKDLPSIVRERVQASPVLRSPIAPTDPSFAGGRNAAMSAMPSKLVSHQADAAQPGTASLEAWRAWLLAVDGVSVEEPQARGRFILNAIETLLIEAREPDRDRSVLAAATELVSRLSWRADEGSRTALLRWFGDKRISSADLRVVTGVLATRSSAEGVDATMVLSTSAEASDREALRDRYANAWGIAQQVNRDQIRQSWGEAASAVLSDVANASADEDRMQAFARLAAMNEAASWVYRGMSDEASSVLTDAKSQSAMAPSTPKPAPDVSLSDGAWAERYLGARLGTKERRDMLTQLLGPRIVLGPIDAEVVVTEWGTTGSADVRMLTTQIIKQCADQESMINAMLERLPRIPSAAASQSLLESVAGKPLPSTRDPQWKIAARRALVERLLDLRGPASGRDVIDRLSQWAARSYRGIAATTPLTPEQRAAAAPAPSESAAIAFRQLMSQADRMIPAAPPPMLPAEIERLHAARQSQARGPIQAFAAQQASLAELMTYAALIEQPSHASEIREILETLRRQRRDAKSIFQQLVETEATMVRLWFIRLEVAPA